MRHAMPTDRVPGPTPCRCVLQGLLRVRAQKCPYSLPVMDFHGVAMLSFVHATHAACGIRGPEGEEPLPTTREGIPAGARRSCCKAAGLPRNRAFT